MFYRTVRKVIPVEQGLRPSANGSFSGCAVMCQKGYSSRTRIKTMLRYLTIILPTAYSQKGYSSRTRIKTKIHMKNTIYSSQKGYSSRTRIKTDRTSNGNKRIEIRSQKGYSSRTRIKTNGKDNGISISNMCQKGYSSRTRIKTLSSYFYSFNSFSLERLFQQNKD